MKKTVVAAGIIIALGMVWTAGAWYTGKQFENRIATVVQQANEQLKRTAPEANVELGYANYQRGIFTSHLDLVIKPVTGTTSPWLKTGQSVVFNERVDHGPFPLAQLKKFNLIPSMASVNTTLANTEASKPLFDIAKGEAPFVANTRIGYSGDSHSDISLKPLDYQSEGEKVAFSGGDFQLEADREGNVFSLSGNADSGMIDAVNEYNQRVQMTFNKLKTEGDSQLTSFDERIGNQKLSVEKLSISVEGKELAVLEGMNIEGKSELGKDNKTVDTQLDYTLDSLKLQNQDMGHGKLTVKIGQIDGQAWHQFSQQYNAQSRALMAQPEVVQNPQLYQQKMTEAFFGALPLLLKGDPVITVAPLSWKNSKGETTFNLSLFLKDPAQNTQPVQSLAQEVDRSVKSLDTKLVIPTDMAIEFMTQIARLEGYQNEEASKLASQQVKGLAAMGQMFRITTMEDDNITARLQYSNGQVTLNGQKMPLEEFVGMFGMPDLGIPVPQPANPAVPAVPADPATPAVPAPVAPAPQQ